MCGFVNLQTVIVTNGKVRKVMITSSANPRVKQIVQWQTKAKERRKDGIFLAEGLKMFEEAPIDRIREVYISQDVEAQLLADEKGKAAQEFAGQEMRAGIAEKLQQVGYEVVTSEIFAKISDTQTPQGILTVLKRREYTLDQLLDQPNPCFVLLENLQDPGNLGTIVRTGEGAGITGVIMSSGTVDIYNPKTIRATMGSVYRVPFLYADNMAEVMDRLHEKGVHTYAAHLKGEVFYDSFSFKEPTAFLIGNEGNGLTKELADKAESYLKIPMEGQVESLNAAIATALLMYETHRQRSISAL